MSLTLRIWLFLTLLTALPLVTTGQTPIKAKAGVMDFQDWDLETSPMLTLEGEWEFYWERHIAPTDYSLADSSEMSYQESYSNWNDYEIDGKKLPAKGFATYRLHLINLPDDDLNLMVRSLMCAAAVYADYELIASVGTVGTNEELEVPKYEDLIVPLPRRKDITLTVFISNFQHRKGGFNDPWYIGTEESIYHMQRNQLMLNGVEACTFLFAGLFFLTLYIYRRKDKAMLFFALYAITFCIRPLVSTNYLITSVLPDLNWSLLVHIEYLSLFLPGAFMILFIRKRYEKQAPQRLLIWIVYVVLLETFITLVTPISIFTWLPIPHQFISLIIFSVLIYVVIRAMKDRESGAVFAGIAMLCLITSSAYTILFYRDIIDPHPFFYTALQLTFLLAMTMILGSKFASQFRKVEYLMVETAEQKEQLEAQNQMVELKNEEITSSITYARRIQKAILPPDKALKELIPKSFILYKPKDIVAGDFYWVERDGDVLYVAAADCTGHGVPGAMVSVVCNAALNRCIREFELTDPGKILDKARELVVATFDQSEEEVKDGMDIALCRINLKTGEVIFAGANNPLWIVRDINNATLLPLENGKVLEEGGIQLIEFKGDKQPIGVHFDPKPFNTTTLTLSPNETIYLFSDGYADQFGGAKGKKYMYKSFKRFVLGLYEEPLEQQGDKFDQEFEEWRAGMEQTDDVCVIGLKL